ncbi:uncharacterized protein E0L32_010008 [Thyridium curvatum]|uniref:Uncharacterized protein n=1 Tax=Thyridium curvatum TaxID=1093900 RepID=A0A507AUD5_9PEZI|nr:uncharacterized protein E0L32_010008 [Thyridium curvatum]TPX08521.1 hypothetical protein E0L32_010008 [Thyridium curvatum]
MFAQTAILLFTAGLAAALPSPTEPENVVADRVLDAPLAKRTTHHGIGTIFLQEGGTGSCGQKNPDSSHIIALSNFWMKNQSPGPFCGRKIQVTNTGSSDGGVHGKGNTIIATVEDTCPSCDENHLDFSEGAWNELTNNSPFSVVNIDWHFCNANGQC